MVIRTLLHLKRQLLSWHIACPLKLVNRGKPYTLTHCFLGGPQLRLHNQHLNPLVISFLLVLHVLLPLVRLSRQIPNYDFPDNNAQDFDVDGTITLATRDATEC